MVRQPGASRLQASCWSEDPDLLRIFSDKKCEGIPHSATVTRLTLTREQLAECKMNLVCLELMELEL